jgi:CheY-like chemotaxis protein
MISVLVVDDDDDVREALAELLLEDGFAVRTASDGREALGVLAEHGPVDVVLLDLTMPVMDGRAFLAARAQSPDIAAIPVVVLSAVADRVQLEGVAVSLRKPVSADVVLSTLRECVAARVSRDGART